MRKEKARIHSWNLKKQAVVRMKAGENISKLAREMKVSRSMLYTWKADAEAGIAFQPGEQKRATVAADLAKLDTGARWTGVFNMPVRSTFRW